MAKKKPKPKKPEPAKAEPKMSQPRGHAPRPRFGAAPGPLEGIARGLGLGDAKRRRSPLALAQELADAAWEAARPQDRAALAQHALDVSADCADAYVILANQAASRQQARELLEEGVAAGARAIGTQAFETSTGHFWLDTRTRPYMRARLGLAQCLWESGQRAEAAEHYSEMLRLNPNDNQGVRYLLLSALVELDRDADAQRLLAQFDQDSSAEWAYTRVLLAFRREGDSEAACALLHAALETNQFVPDYLLGNKAMPAAPPSYVSPGGEDEATSYVAQFLRNWRGTPGAIPWVRKTLKIPLPHQPKQRKPPWSLFRQTFLRLPKAPGEVWQIDICRLPPLPSAANPSPAGSLDDSPAEPAEPSREPWALVLWNRSLDAIMTFEAGDDQPTIGQAWQALIEAMLRPRAGDPHRPVEIHVRRKTFFKAWQQKLRQIEVACRLFDELDGLDEVLESLLPASTRVRRLLDGPELPEAVDLDDLAALPQNAGEVWQADIRRLPGWLEEQGELRRPWASLVTSRDEHAVLTQNLTIDAPPPEWIWKNVVDAMLQPLMGEPHRPGVIEVVSDDFRNILAERLEVIGVRCVAADDLAQIDEIFHQLGKFLSGGKSAPPLVEVPGVRLDDIRGFYDAAAEFYRAAPWRLVPGDTVLKIECSKYQAHTWYAVVMGQSGLVLGLALYEDLQMLQRLFSGQDSDEKMSHDATGLSVMFGEAFEVPVLDLDAAERHHWPVAAEEAYPNPIYVNPGRSMRPPLQWELELLEASLRAVPQFLRGGANFDVPCARGIVTLQISQM